MSAAREKSITNSHAWNHARTTEMELNLAADDKGKISTGNASQQFKQTKL